MALGHEAAGIVEEIGPEHRPARTWPSVTMWCSCSCPPAGTANRAPRVGRRCANRARPATPPGTLLSGSRRLHRSDGTPVHHHLGVSGFADYAVVSRRSLVKIDPDLPMEEAALFGCAVLTGVGAVVNTARMPLGASAAVIGLGGVGLASLLGAVASGAREIVAIDRADDKLAFALRAGCHRHAVNSTDPDAADQIKAATGGGVEFAFDLTGVPAALDLAFKITRRGGTTVTAGSAATHRDPAAEPAHPGRRGTHPQGQLHRHLGAQPGHPALHRPLPTRTAAGEPADERHAQTRRHQRGLRPAAFRQGHPPGRAAVRGTPDMSVTPWDDMTRGWTEMYDQQTELAKELVRRPDPTGQHPGRRTTHPGRRSTTNPLADAAAMAELWRSWTALGGSLGRSLPGVSAGGGIAAETLGRMTDPLAMSLAGGGEVGNTIRRMTEGPRFADIGAAEHRMAKLMELWISVQTAARTYESVVAGAWMTANQRFARDISSRSTPERRSRAASKPCDCGWKSPIKP